MQVILELGEDAEMSGRKPAKEDMASSNKGGETFSPWDVDDSREIKTGLRIVMRKEEQVGSKTISKVPAAG